MAGKQSQPDRSLGYNRQYWNAVVNEMQAQYKPKMPPFGNWKPLGPVNPQSAPLPPAKPAPDDYKGRPTRKDG